MTTDDLELLRGMWAACVDDLERWAKAFESLDPGSQRKIIRLIEGIRTRAATITEVP